MSSPTLYCLVNRVNFKENHSLCVANVTKRFSTFTKSHLNKGGKQKNTSFCVDRGAPSYHYLLLGIIIIIIIIEKRWGGHRPGTAAGTILWVRTSTYFTHRVLLDNCLPQQFS